jgi:hypothetical protein
MQPATITPEALATFDKLDKIFMPEANRQLQRWFKAPQKSARLVHYTTADGGLKIINSKHFWMRNTNLMADYREVQHGFTIFHNFFANEAKRDRFTQVLDSCSIGVAVEALRVFDHAWKEPVPFDTYITLSIRTRGRRRRPRTVVDVESVRRKRASNRHCLQNTLGLACICRTWNYI